MGGSQPNEPFQAWVHKSQHCPADVSHGKVHDSVRLTVTYIHTYIHHQFHTYSYIQFHSLIHTYSYIHTPPPTRAPRAPFACGGEVRVPSVAHETVGSMRPSRACPACRSPIFARCVSPPGTACGCATLRALSIYSVPHGPHEVRRVLLAGRESRVGPLGAPARARPSCRALELRGVYLVPFHAPPRVHARPVRRLLEREAPRTLPASFLLQNLVF